MLDYKSNTYAIDARSITTPPDGDRYNGETQYPSLASPVPVDRSMVEVVENSWKNEPDSEVSFSKVKQDRLIKMTPYEVGSVITRNYLAQRPRQSWKGLRYSDSWSSGGNIHVWDNGKTTLNPKWSEFWSYDDLIQAGVDHFQIDADQKDEVEGKLDSVSATVIDQLSSSYDLLTELAESPQLLRMIISLLKAARDPLKGIADLRKRYSRARSRGKTHREVMLDLSDEWLQYRYAIMPIVFSVKDIIDLLNSKGTEFKTERSSESIHLSEDSKSSLWASYLYDVIRGEIKVSATGKLRYGEDSSRLLDQISINPFLTAWELVPFSFVIDWFVNIGDVLSAYTTGLFSSAEQRRFCRSVKYDTSLSTFWSDEHNDSYYRFLDEEKTRDGQVQRPDTTWDFSETSRIESMVRSTHTRKYVRTLFNPTDASFAFSPSMSWMRDLDAIALTLKKIF